ncbi:cyclic nucleotide-gated ion channel 1-like [Rosa sericea]
MKENIQDPAQDSHTQGHAANPGDGKDQNSLLLAIKRHSQPNQWKKTLLVKIQCTSWDTILVIPCVIAVSVDPLFFYLPFIDEKSKCVGMDKNLRIAALLLRAITDLALILNIIFQIKYVAEEVVKSSKNSVNNNPKNNEGKDSRIWFAKELARKMPWHSILIDILAVLPIPQVIMTVFFKMRSSKYLGRSKIIDVFLLVQYLPRIYLMHHSSKELKEKKGVWTRGAFYFFLYILASHVLGGFWYFFSIQQETSCWHRACMKHSTSECNFHCDQDISSRNMTFISSLDEFCLVDVPANATAPFDFGIFIDSVKSGNTRQINFAKKFFYSFWWGLRNLSNFGTNLETSTYVFENCFAILISTVGLLLFLYLIGKVQTFISMETEKSEGRRIKLSSTKADIQLWMHRNGLTEETKKKINEIVGKEWEKIKDADLENIFSILHGKIRTSLKQFLCRETLSKALEMSGSAVLKGVKTMEKKSGQENKDTVQEKVLTSICDILKPVIYPDGRYVYQIGEPLDRMLLITDGLICTYNTTSISRSTSSGSTSQDEGQGTGLKCLGKGAFYGDELLSWASDSLKSCDDLPMLKANAKAHGKVEGFILMAKDLKGVVDNHKNCWLFSDSQEGKEVACQTIQKAFRQFKQQQKHQQKVLQSEASKVLVVPPTSPVMAPQPEAAVVLEIPSDQTEQ